MVALLDRPPKVGVRVRDASRQKQARAEAPSDATVGELVEGLLKSRMRLPQQDSEGRALSYWARLEREGRHLHSSERVGDALREDDELVLQPSIQAGCR
jgi:hypothetical protein